jgi:hypothetical protein
MWNIFLLQRRLFQAHAHSQLLTLKPQVPPGQKIASSCHPALRREKNFFSKNILLAEFFCTFAASLAVEPFKNYSDA